MMQYTNGFSCVIDKEKEDLIINFIQNIPVISKEGIEDELEKETIASLVMGRQTAINLRDALIDMLDEEDIDEEDVE